MGIIDLLEICLDETTGYAAFEYQLCWNAKRGGQSLLRVLDLRAV